MLPSAVGHFIRARPSHASSTFAAVLRIAKTHNSFLNASRNTYEFSGKTAILRLRDGFRERNGGGKAGTAAAMPRSLHSGQRMRVRTGYFGWVRSTMAIHQGVFPTGTVAICASPPVC